MSVIEEPDLIKPFFPFDEYRPNQRNIILDIIKAFKKNDNVIFEGVCGSGKSVIGMTIANIMKSVYYITIQKILMDQINRDFEDIVLLKGRNAYPCWYINEFARAGQKIKDDKLRMADRGECVNRRKSFLKFCLDDHKCDYANQLFAAEKSPQTLFNFSSFLFQKWMAGRFDKKRKLLIIDEAHQIESQIMNFVEARISSSDIDEELPKLNSVEMYMKYFEAMDLSGKMLRKMEESEEAISDIVGVEVKTEKAEEPENFGAGGNRDLDIDEVAKDEIKSLSREDRQLVETHLKKIDKFKSCLTKYSMLKTYVKEVRCVHDYDDEKKAVVIKPLYATYHTPRLLFDAGEKRLFMSATILNPSVFGESIGMDMSKTKFIKTDHTFPVANRPIYLDYAGPMSFRNRNKTMPKMITKVNKLMDKYPDDKGIIHCQSFWLADQIIGGVSKKNKKRLLDQRNFRNKYDMLSAHDSSPNSVIIAPAMHEGLDLRNELSRFQLIIKIPFPNSNADKQLKIRSEENWGYYLWLTALKLVQSCGRSIRSETDWAHTYILDSDFDSFFNRADNLGLMPDWFVESLVVED